MDGYNITVPIEEDKSLRAILDSCLREEGSNKKHSRTIKLEGHKKPINGYLTPGEMKRLEIEYTLEVLRYYALKCYNYLRDNGCDLGKPVCTYIAEFSNPNITGRDLIILLKHNNKELLEIARSDRNDEFAEYIRIFTTPGEGIRDPDIFKNNALYKDSLPDDENERECSFFRVPVSKRIYMNLPRNSSTTYKFGLLYIKKCIDRGIPFSMKLFGSVGHEEFEIDGSVFYSRNAYFLDHLEIIEEILNENPAFKREIGSSISTGGSIVDQDGRSYMTISHNGRGETYNDCVDRIINYMYAYSCCQYIDDHYPMFSSRLDKDTARLILSITRGPLDADTIKKIGVVHSEVRAKIFELRSEDPERAKRMDDELITHMRNNMPMMKSIITFGDLEHTNVPIYMDKYFCSLVERTRGDKGTTKH